MPIEVCRPGSTITNGAWSLTPSSGATLDEILSDDSDLTWISSSQRIDSDATFAVFDFADVILPDGAKIKSVTLRLRTFQTAPAGGGSFPSLFELVRFYIELAEEVVEDVVEGDLGDGLGLLFRFLFGFPNPTPPSGGAAAWQTTTIKSYPQKPSGGEWDIDTFNALTWKIGRTDSGTTLVKISEYFVDLEYNERPVVTITGPVSPVDDTTRPRFTFTYADPENDPKDAHRVKVFTQAQVDAVGFDVEISVPVAQTDWVPGVGLTWVCNKDLPNDDYVGFVQVRQKWDGIGEHRSEWDSWVFTVDVEGPDTPIVTATPNDTANWVQIDLAPDGDNVPATETYTVWYSDNNGVKWDVVRDGWQIQADDDGIATLVDYEAPLHRTRWYKAKGYRTLTGVKVASDESNIAQATPRARGWWFKDLAAPSLNLRIVVLDDVESFERVQGVFPVLTKDDGASVAYKKVVNGPVSGIDGELVLFFKGNDDTSGYDQFQSLYRPGRDLLLQSPTGKNWYVQLGKQVKVPWKARGTNVYWRTPGVTFTEVGRPIDPKVPPNAAP